MSAETVLAQLVQEAEALYADAKRYAGPIALSERNGDIPASILFIGEAPGRRLLAADRR